MPVSPLITGHQKPLRLYKDCINSKHHCVEVVNWCLATFPDGAGVVTGSHNWRIRQNPAPELQSEPHGTSFKYRWSLANDYTTITAFDNFLFNFLFKQGRVYLTLCPKG